jgi:catechol 2,3-dioxygenase-like lactoylglutathione lyase family enzyme
MHSLRNWFAVVPGGKSWSLGWSSGSLCLLLAALLIVSGHSCAAQAPAKAPELAGIAHAAIRVSDLDKSRAFYLKLGFEQAFAMEQGGTTTQAFIKVNDRQFLELYPKGQPSQPVGFMHVCFESADLEGLHRFYAEQGLSPSPVKRGGAGNMLFTMQGPEQQNIEYSQYMPGSMHSLDRGKHLNANRIAERIVAVGIEMRNPAAALSFYSEKLGFSPASAFEPGQIWLGLPGQSGQQVEIAQHTEGSAVQLFFSVPDLQRTGARLKALHLTVEKRKSALTIQDPDGNRIVFVKSKPV